jgi:hypothetical protein
MRYPGAHYRPLGSQSEPLMKSHDIVCVHTMVGYLTSTDAMFRKGGYTGTESHYGVGGIWGPDKAAGLDGVAYCWQDDTRAADANLDGWHRVISIETADNAPGKVEDIAGWTPAQCETTARIIAYHCERENIPAVLISDTKPGQRGIAYHRQGCLHSDGLGSHPGWLVTGGERWSSSKGKGCPGPRRIEQLKTIIIPRVRVLLAPAPTAPEVPVADEDKAEVDQIRRGTLAAIETQRPLMPYVDSLFSDTDNQMSLWQAVQHGAAQALAARETAGTALEELATLKTQNAELRELVTDLTGTQSAMATTLLSIVAQLDRLTKPTP